MTQKIIWREGSDPDAAPYAVAHDEGGTHYNRGPHYVEACRYVIDLRRWDSSTGTRRYYAPRVEDVGARPAEVRGRCSPAQLDALVEWCKRANAAEPARLERIKREAEQREMAWKILQNETVCALEELGRVEMGDEFIDGGSRQRRHRLTLFLANGIRARAEIVEGHGVAVTSWEHPMLQSAGISTLKALARLEIK